MANANLLNATAVTKQVATKIGRPFNLHHHTLAWQKFKVRRSGFDPAARNTKYCVADPRHKDYGYTAAWVDFLVGNLSAQAEYDALIAFAAPSA